MLVISHRFSTERMADLIIVRDHEQLLAVGSHEQLMRRGGLYAEIHRLQAKGYR